ncbi:MAG: hypothetical protein DYH18_06465 [Xanthomonadales bacterium PRO7]|nr:hypothetical protein [Xanthomonadales bacterium PRO7]
MEYQAFDLAISENRISSIDRAVAMLWLGKVVNRIEGMTAKEIASIVENDCGHPQQNINRLSQQLRSDRRTAKYGEGFRLKPNALKALTQQYQNLLASPSAPKIHSTLEVVPRAIFEPARRGYLLRLIDQVNGCYQNGYFDGVMVLGRKLLETLVIEVYAQNGRSAEIKRADGAFLPLEDLSGKISSDNAINITRETKKSLAALKKFGDQSAHNQRFTAQLTDVDEIKHGFRIAAEELLHHCNYANKL